MLTVASGSGYWRDNAPPTKRKALLWWWCIQPVITALCGCLPGKRLGLIGDLPAGVVWQWRRWCMHPSYSLGVEGERARQSYAAVRYPVHALSMTDDEMMSWNSTRSLLSWYRNAPRCLNGYGLPMPVSRASGISGFSAVTWPIRCGRAAAVLEQWLGPAGDMEGLPGDRMAVRRWRLRVRRRWRNPLQWWQSIAPCCALDGGGAG
jgi:hypothetical protein